VNAPHLYLVEFLDADHDMTLHEGRVSVLPSKGDLVSFASSTGGDTKDMVDNTWFVRAVLFLYGTPEYVRNHLLDPDLPGPAEDALLPMPVSVVVSLTKRRVL
jgi:hypothetical protein